MRIVLSVLALAVSFGPAAAQDWSGPYAGVTAGLQSFEGGDFKVSVQGLRDPRLTYTVPPGERTVSGPDFDTGAFSALHAGWRVPVGPVVAGLEAQIQQGAADARFDTGPLNYSTLESGFFTACGDPALGCLFAFLDRATARVSIENTASLRASLGLPVSDRLLVSAYVGPSVASGEIALSQTTQLTTARPRPPGTGCMIGCSFPIITDSRALSVTRAGDDTAWGVVAGVTADLKLTERVLARGEVGYARYEALRLDGESSETRVWAQPVSVQATFGLSVRF